MPLTHRRRTLGVYWGLALAALGSAGAALAHHGWAWTEEAETQLSGQLEKIYLGNPHAHIELRNERGLWQVDLAPPGPTAHAGFVEGVAKVGDTATVTGHRSKDLKELTFKAETITVGGKTYDVYPNRPKSLKPGS